MCETIYECFLNIFNYGLSGGLAEITMNEHLKDNKSNFFKKWLLDISFFFIINLFATEIVAGIIIDTFGELREKTDEKSKIFLKFIIN